MSQRNQRPSSLGGYDAGLEVEAQGWIEAVTGESFERGFAEELQDGRRLCLLMNEIRPGSIRRVNDSRMPFKQMENTSNFLKACREVGVPEYSLFETVDLFDLRDIGLVVKCLHALGGVAQVTCPDFKGPHLGTKPVAKTIAKFRRAVTATTAARTFSQMPSVRTAAQVSDAPKTSGGWSAVRAGGGHGASASELTRTSPPEVNRVAPAQSSPPVFTDSAVHHAESRYGTSDVGNADTSMPPPPPFDPSASRWDDANGRGVGLEAGQNDDDSDTVDLHRAQVDDSLAPPPYQDIPVERSSSSALPAKNIEGLSPELGDMCLNDNDVSGSSTTASSSPYEACPSAPSPAAARVSPRPGISASPSRTSSLTTTSAVGQPCVAPMSHSFSASPPHSPSPVDPVPTRVPNAGRGGGYGLDAELAAKREANYDYESEAEAQEWIEAVTGGTFEQSFGEELRDGRRLCFVLNEICPGTVRRVNQSRMPFKQMENISNFLKGCRALGVAEHSLFETVDLFELKDLGLVVRCLHALGQTVQRTCPEYNGPRLGIRQTDPNIREWTPEQQAEQVRRSSGAMTQLMAGSSTTMERGSILKEGVTFGASTAGTGDVTVPAKWTMGSHTTMERASISRTGPTFGAEYAGTGDRNSVSKVTQGFR